MNQRLIIDSIRNWSEHDSLTQSVFLLGSQARQDSTYLSDVDVVIENPGEPSVILLKLQEILPIVYHQFWPDGKLVLWVGTTLTKVDCWILADAKDAAKYFWGSNPDDFDDWILLDRDGDLEKRLLDTAAIPAKYNDIDWLNKRFVNQLEAASRHHARSDTFRYMFAMQIAYDALIRLACHLAGETSSLHLPKAGHRVLDRLLPQWTSDRFGTTGSLRTANERKRNLLNCWNDLHELARMNKFDLGEFEAGLEFLNLILERDHFWNTRDIIDGTTKPLASGRVFRGACLVPHLGESALDAFLESSGIQWIVDLRREEERLERPYPADFPVQVYHCPTWNTVERPVSWPHRQPEWNNDYPGNLSSMAPHVPLILKLIASGEVGYIHCHAGRDRTGVICALILRMLECSVSDLRCSYGLSSDADMDAIEVMLDWIEDEERFVGLLEELDVGESLVNGVRGCLLPELSQEELT